MAAMHPCCDAMHALRSWLYVPICTEYFPRGPISVYVSYRFNTITRWSTIRSCGVNKGKWGQVISDTFGQGHARSASDQEHQPTSRDRRERPRRARRLSILRQHQPKSPQSRSPSMKTEHSRAALCEKIVSSGQMISHLLCPEEKSLL